MTTMYPPDIEDFEEASEGEKRFFRFLKEAARPHNDFICWYAPSIGVQGIEPDFVLFGKTLGLIILEVKDWSLQQIGPADHHHFTIYIAERQEERKNPDKQAKAYVDKLVGALKQVPSLLSDRPPHQGKLKIPIGRMAVFTNISHQAFLDRGLQGLIPAERALFQDDLDPAGEILCDSTGSKFCDRISGAIPFPFDGLSLRDIDKLHSVIWPEVRIDLPKRQGAGRARFQREVLALDETQARIARHLKRGHQIIKGPPGSGKTLVLVHRCCHLQKYNPQLERILFVCYNIALVSYLKRLFQEKGIGVGEDGIHVFHFFELCSQILEEPVHYEKEEAEYYELVLQEAKDRVKNGKCCVAPFDAVFIDEGQDFNDEMLETVLTILKSDGDLVIGLDSYQDLYRTKRSWKSLGIKASGRTRYLGRVYRNTGEIFNFTQRFIGQTPSRDRQLALLPDEFSFRGESPELHPFANYEEIEEFLVQDLRDCIDRGEYKRSEIAIIYDDKIYVPDGFTYDNRAFPFRILKKLEASGIPSRWVSQDARAKELFDITTDRVSLVSIHSSKGLDFDLVYLLGIDRIRPAEHTRKNLAALIYVAMTRAKYRLVIPYAEESEFIARMKECLPTT